MKPKEGVYEDYLFADSVASRVASTKACRPVEQPFDMDDSSFLLEEFGNISGSSHELCNALAVATVLHEPISQSTMEALHAFVPGCSVQACTLGVVGESGAHLIARELLHGQIMEKNDTSADSFCKTVAAGSALWESFASAQTLMWRRGKDPFPVFSDWLCTIEHCPRAVDALVTLPLHTPGSRPMGAVTLALQHAPDVQGMAALQSFAQRLCGAIGHHTTNLWEVSLGFLMQVVPQKVLSRMLMAASTKGTGARPSSIMVAGVQSDRAADGAGGGKDDEDGDGKNGQKHGNQTTKSIPDDSTGNDADKRRSADYTLPKGGDDARHGPPCRSTPAAATCAPNVCHIHAVECPLLHNTEPQVDAVLVSAGHLSPLSPRCSNGTVVSVLDQSSLEEMSPLTLEFRDPLEERSFRRWFDASQYDVDRNAGLLCAAVFATLLAASLLKGGLSTLPLAIFLQTGLPIGCIALPFTMALMSKAQYNRHRTSFTLFWRLCGTICLMWHWTRGVKAGTMNPPGALRSWAARGIGRLLLLSAHTRLRFAVHAFALLADLYLCAVGDAFVFLGQKKGAPDGGAGLGWTLGMQLLAGLLASAALYVHERHLRRKFCRGLQPVQPGVGRPS